MLYIVALTILLSPVLSTEGVASTDERFWHLLEKLDQYNELEEVTAEHGISELKATFVNNIENEGEDEGEEMDSVINLMNKSDYEETVESYDLKADDEEEEEEEEPVISDTTDLPETLDWRLAEPAVLTPVVNQGPCGSCGTISGTHCAESRMAIASGTYRHYSVQQQMNCQEKGQNMICRGFFSPAIWYLMKKLDYQVDSAEMPYLAGRKKCGADYVNCQCDLKNKENVFDDQLAFLGATRSLSKTASDLSMVQALQTGPVTICYTAQKGQNVRNVTQCGSGASCNHASIVVGYDKDFFFVKNTYGKNWGLQGYWMMNRKSDCWTKQGSRFARYPVVWEDYSKTGAMFAEDSLDYSITLATTSDYNVATIGRAKKTCGLMGDQCVAIVQTVDKAYQLVSAMTPSDGPLSDHTTLYKKTQFIVRLYNEGTKQYLTVGGGDVMTLSDQGTPFFMANGQFRVYTRPDYQLVGASLVKVTDTKAQWGLKNCNLNNVLSGASLSIQKKKRGYAVKGGIQYDGANLLQRFNLGLSSRWNIEAAHQKVRVLSKTSGQLVTSTKAKKGDCFTWNARQIVSCTGKAVRPEMWKLDDKQHSARDTQNTVQPTDCSLHALDDDSMLNVDNGQVKMTSSLSPLGGGWTFEYEDI